MPLPVFLGSLPKQNFTVEILPQIASYITGGRVMWCRCFEVWQFLKMLNMELAYDLKFLLLATHSTEIKICSNKHLYTTVPNSIINYKHKAETTQMSLNRWIDKMCYIHIEEYYSAINRNQILTWVHLDILGERNQLQKATNCMIWYKFLRISQAWWPMHVITTLWEAEARESQI